MSAEAMRKYRENHPNYDRDWWHSPTGKANKARWQKRYRALNKEKVLAHAAVGKAVKSGRLLRLPCERCGSNNVHAHHYMGYEREHRLTVKWLCPDHHREAHSLIR